MIGKTISHDRLLKQLGRGMGVVYKKAEDAKLGRFVALRVLLPSSSHMVLPEFAVRKEHVNELQQRRND